MSPGSVTAIVRGKPTDTLLAGEGETPHGLPSDAIFYVGSIAKQFVASCIAFLERDGSLDLEDPVSRFVPRLPAWGERVSIRHLIHHTGGVKERSREGPGVPADGVPAWGNAELLETLRQVADLDFEPGSRYGYSNRGYLLLAEVVAAASGSSLADLARERIFEPLGMRCSRRPCDLAASNNGSDRFRRCGGLGHQAEGCCFNALRFCSVRRSASRRSRSTSS